MWHEAMHKFGLSFLVGFPMLYWGWRGILPLVHGWPNGCIPHPNDMNFHSMLTKRMVDAGSNNAWVHLWGMGTAVLRYYQNFGHLQAALLCWLTGLSPEVTTPLVNAIYMFFWPLSVYWCGRKFGFAKMTCGSMAFMTTLVEGEKGDAWKHLFGLQLRCFSWDGWGLFTQIVAAVWMAIAYGQCYEYILSGRGFLLASVAISFSWLSHLIVGYGVSILTILIVAAGDVSNWKIGLRRWFQANLVAGLGTMYLNLPTALEKHILNRSVFEPANYWDSYGFFRVIPWLFQGFLLDASWDRAFPYMTLLVLASFVACAVQFTRWTQREPQLRFLMLGFLGGLLLFTGRHTFGPLVNLMPFSYNLPFHRFYVQFHFFAILLAGWGLAEAHHWITEGVAWGWRHKIASKVAGCLKRPVSLEARSALAVVVFICMLCLFIPFALQYARETRQHRDNLDAQRKDLDEWWGVGTFDILRSIEKKCETHPGRSYAGGAWNWGKDFTLKFLKFFSLFSSRGFALANVGMMYHAMGLLGDHDFYFNQSRPDHYNLYNIRYVVGRVGTPLNGSVVVSNVHGDHAAHMINETDGYFRFVKLVGCYDAWRYDKDDNWYWRQRYITGFQHSEGIFYHMPLVKKHACITSTVQLSDHMPQGSISLQRGNVDDFSATIDCQEADGCTVVLKITYHPNFVVTRASSGEQLLFFPVSPSFIGFQVPLGIDSYRVRWHNPAWSVCLFWACYIWMVGALLSHLYLNARAPSPPSSPLSSPSPSASLSTSAPIHNKKKEGSRAKVKPLVSTTATEAEEEEESVVDTPTKKTKQVSFAANLINDDSEKKVK